MSCATPWQTSVQLPENVPVSTNTGTALPVFGSTIRTSKLMRCVWEPVPSAPASLTPCGSWQAEHGAPAARCPLCPPPEGVRGNAVFLKLTSRWMLD